MPLAYAGDARPRRSRKQWYASLTAEQKETWMAANAQWYKSRPESFKEKRRVEGRERYVRVRAARPWQLCFYRAKSRAKKLGREFTLTPDWCHQRYTGRCEVTGIVFKNGGDGQRSNPASASLDRIDSSKGYNPENCRFVTVQFNGMKQNVSDEDFIRAAGHLKRWMSER